MKVGGLLVLGLALVVAPAIAQTPDGETPAAEAICDLENGSAFGLCNAYCEAMDCHLANDADSATSPKASAKACGKTRATFMRQTGRDLPCEKLVACPCYDPQNWQEPDVGELWKFFAEGLFFPSDTICTDNEDVTQLLEGEESVVGAVVDAVLLECQVVDGGFALDTLIIGADQVEACRDLLRDAASLRGLDCNP